MRRARRLVIQGRVQGVGFRYFTLRCAHAARVSGFVRNNPDGSVEIWAEGAKESLDSFEADLRQGPPLSRVDFVEVEQAAARGERGFEIR